MIEENLYSTSGALVTQVLAPTRVNAPQVLLWNDRAFERRANGKYYEVDAVPVWTREEYRQFNGQGIVT